jgi:hypothetical protein
VLAVKDYPECDIVLTFISCKLINFISNEAIETEKINYLLVLFLWNEMQFQRYQNRSMNLVVSSGIYPK